MTPCQKNNGMASSVLPCKKYSECRFLWLKSWLASAGTGHLARGILWSACHNQFRVTCANSKEVKTMTAKSSGKEEGESE
jgi:hypothetical protein